MSSRHPPNGQNTELHQSESLIRYGEQNNHQYYYYYAHRKDNPIETSC